MGIAKGSTTITAVRKGSITIAKIMKGSTQIFAPGGGAPAGVIADSGFADPAYWTVQNGGEVSGGFAEFNMPYVGSSPVVFRSGAVFTSGATYNYSLTISEYAGGNMRAFAGAETPGYGTAHAANGTFTGTLVAGGNGAFTPSAGLQGAADFIGKVDNFTLELVP